MHPSTARRAWLLVLPLAVACSSAASSVEEPGGSAGLATVGETALDGSTSTTGIHVDAGADAAASDAGATSADASDGGPVCLGAESGPDPVCPASGPCAGLCESVVAHYQSGVARFAAACITGLGSCTSATDVIPCVDQATARACPVDDALTYCQGFVSRCDPNADNPELASAISTAGCVAIASGLGAAGRASFRNCIEDAIQAGTCANDVIACADAIRQ